MSSIRLVLKNKAATAVLLPNRGGLLSSLVVSSGGKEQNLLWTPPDFQEDAAVSSGWPGGGAPWLFPFAGRVFVNGQVGRYDLKDALRETATTYEMPIHGFGYGSRWQVESYEPEADSATLMLSSNDATRQFYPFDFELKARYELSANGIRCSLKVTASCRNATSMPIAVGMHPYFRMPLADAGDLSQCDLRCAAKEEIRVTPVGGAGRATALNQSLSAALNSPHLHNLILGKLQADGAALIDREAKQIVSVTSKPRSAMQYFVLWTKPEQGFYCLEPWMGLPDAVMTGAGVRWLHPSETLNLLVEISCSPL